MLDFKRRIRRGKPRLKMIAATRRDLVQKFEQNWLAGASRAEAAAEIGVSIGTVDRWRRELAKSQVNADRVLLGIEPIDINAAIACLISEENLPFLTKLEALFIFMAWIRWPNFPACHHIAISAYLTSYFQKRTSVVLVSQLAHDEAALVCRYLNLLDIRDAFSMTSMRIVHFDLPYFRGSEYHDYDLAAIIVRLILDGSAKGNRQSSLTKAFEIIATQSFLKVRFFSLRGLFNFWPTVAASAPFCYVNQFEFGYSYLLDPKAEDFADKIDELLLPDGRLRIFFAQSLWVVNFLSKNLDRRALRSIAFPAFPADLNPLEAPPPRRVTLKKPDQKAPKKAN